MNIGMQKATQPSDIRWGAYRLGLHGSILDERGKVAVDEMRDKVDELLALRYDPHSFEVTFDAERVEVDSLTETLRARLSGRTLLETTTLGFVEMLLCCRTLRQVGADSFDLLYVEPESYRSPRRRHLLHRRDFELSGEVPGYRAIPGFGVLLGDRAPWKGVFFLGYEEARLRRAFEDLQMIRPSETAIVFGVPAFKVGWEMDAVANNIAVIREQNIRGGLHYCGAEEPSLGGRCPGKSRSGFGCEPTDVCGTNRYETPWHRRGVVRIRAKRYRNYL